MNMIRSRRRLEVIIFLYPLHFFYPVSFFFFFFKCIYFGFIISLPQFFFFFFFFFLDGPVWTYPSVLGLNHKEDVVDVMAGRKDVVVAAGEQV